MIEPILLYCHPILLGSETLINRFQKVQDRAFKIVFGTKTINKWIAIETCINRLAILDVLRCLNGTAPSPYEDYFTRIEHKVNIRNNKKNVILPKFKTESGIKSFMSQGGKLWNTLPTDLKN